MAYPPRLALIGMMGAGKTTAGRATAQALGWRYLDSDEQVQLATGQTVPEIFASSGETAFRRAEAMALRVALSGGEPQVVAVAGGAVLDPANRQLIRANATAVWLRARPETLAKRVGDGAGRPLLGDDPLAALTRLEAERRPYYAELAAHTIEVDDLGSEDVVDQLVTLAREVPRRSGEAEPVR